MAGFETPLMLSIAILAIPAIYVAFRNSERYNKLIGASRVLIIILLAAAAAQPFVQAEQEISSEAEVVILEDESNSAELMQKEELGLEDVKVTRRTIASGNSSDLKNSLLRNLEENRHYLVSSDFQSSSSLESVGEQFRSSNSTISAIEYDMDPDTAVSIEGPATTVPGAESRFLISVHSTEQPIEPDVEIDGEKVQPLSVDNNTWEVKRTFSDKGSHTVKTSIPVNDSYSNNNNYYHGIEVTEKPDILIIGGKDVLGDKLSKFYDITYRRDLPSDLSSYYSVISTKKLDNGALTSYVSEGNGFIYTGELSDDKSMDILPIIRQDPSSLTDATKTVLAIDNSRELGGEDEDARKTTLRMSMAVIDGLQTNNKVGLVYYNGTNSFKPSAGLLSSPIPLSRNREKLKDKIAGLQSGGPAFHNAGLEASKDVVNSSGNIIMLTDGYLASGADDRSFKSSAGYQIQQDSYRIAKDLDSKLIIIQVGSPPGNENKERAEDFLNQLATKSGGKYYRAGNILNSDGTTINLLGGGGAAGKSTPVNIVDSEHFITERIQMRTYVEKTEPAETKRGARELARISNGNPFLTVWRYGIGRTAAFTGDTNQLENTMRTDPLLVSRTVSWTVGDPKRKLDKWLRVENSRRPNEVEARANYEIEGFKRQGEDTYTRTITPNSTGFGSVEGKFYGYNYPQEYERVGYSDKIEGITSSTGGKVYSPDDTEEMVEDIKNFNEKQIVKRQELGSYLIALALLIFLAEVGFRKVNGKK